MTTGTGMGNGPSGGFKLRHANIQQHRTQSPKQRITDRYKPQIKLLRKQIQQMLRQRKTASPTTKAQMNNRLMQVKDQVRALQIQMDRQLSQIPLNQKHLKSGKETVPQSTEKNQ